MRLTRVGSKRTTSYRVVVADSRSPRDGMFIESSGATTRRRPSTIDFDEDRVKEWLSKGRNVVTRSRAC